VQRSVVRRHDYLLLHSLGKKGEALEDDKQHKDHHDFQDADYVHKLVTVGHGYAHMLVTVGHGPAP
jgi:hypothetical protein